MGTVRLLFKTDLTMCNTTQWILSSNHEINQSLKIKIIKDITLFFLLSVSGNEMKQKIPQCRNNSKI